MTRAPDDNDRYALYQHAHHDLWWAKAQQWNVGNWALLLIAAVVTVPRTLLPQCELITERTWPFVSLAVIVALAATWYLANLRKEIVHNRKVYRALEEQTGIKELRKQIPQAAGEETDRTRGIHLLYVMAFVFAMAVGFAASLLGASSRAGLIIGVGVAAANAFQLWRAA